MIISRTPLRISLMGGGSDLLPPGDLDTDDPGANWAYGCSCEAGGGASGGAPLLLLLPAALALRYRRKR